MAANILSAAQNRPRPKPLYRFFTTCPQDWFIVVLRGEGFHRVIHEIKGWYVDEDGEFQPENPNDPEKQHTVSPIMGYTGYDFVGLPPFQGILVYKFAWNKYWRKTEGGTEMPEYTAQVHDQEEVWVTPFEAQYPLVYGGMDVVSTKREQTIEEVLIPIGIVVTVRVRMRNPRIALCTNSDWFGQVLTPNIQKSVKEYIGGRTYDWMIREAKASGSKEFSDQFMSSGAALNDFSQIIRRDAGVEIVNIGITDVIPNKQYESALFEQAVSERKARATIAEAEGKKKARELEGEGEKAYYEAIANSVGRENVENYIKWNNVRFSNLTTYAEAGSKTAGIIIGPDGKPAR